MYILTNTITAVHCGLVVCNLWLVGTPQATDDLLQTNTLGNLLAQALPNIITKLSDGNALLFHRVTVTNGHGVF